MWKKFEDNNSNSPKSNEEYDENLKDDVSINKSKNINDEDETIINNIYDPTQWKILDSKLIDLLIKKGPIREILDFPRDKNSRHFFIVHYIQKLPNWEKPDRKWLVYSKKLDKMFYYFCKLFSLKSNI